MRERACKNCGGKSYEVVGQNMVRCQFCGTLYVDEHASKEEEVLLVGAYNLAREQKFDEAIAEFDKILTLYPLSFESFYGRCLAKNKIIFYSGKYSKKPRFFGEDIPSILQDEDFLLAVKNAPNETAKIYQEQAKKIERLHQSYSENKDKKFDVVLCDPKLDKQNSVTLQAVEKLKEEGLTPYFLQALEEKENEALTFCALKTCKVFVLFANDKKGYTNADIRNLYDRYLYFILQKQKAKTSFIIVLDQDKVSLDVLPKELNFCKSVLDINSSSFLQDFTIKVKHEMEKTVEEMARIDTIAIEQVSPQKKEYLNVDSIEPTDLGHYHVDNVKLTDENKIKWLFLSLKNGDFVSAKEVIESELAKNGASSDILFAQMLYKRQIKTPEEFFSSITNFQDKNEIDELLKISNKQFAEYFVDSLENLIIKLDNVDYYHQYLLYLAGFNTPNRENFVQMAENKAVETLDEELIEMVLKCFKANDIDRFVNFYFMLAQKSDDKTYYDKILQIDQGHEQSNMAILLSHFKTAEDILTYRNREEVEEVFKFLSEDSRARFVSAVIGMILPVAFCDLEKAQAQIDFYLAYVTDTSKLVALLREVAISLQRMRFFKLAERYISIAISKEPNRAEFYWFLISIKAHCVSDSEMVMSVKKITQFPEWETLLSVADEQETEKYAAIASKINLYEGQKLPFKEELLDKKKLSDDIQTFLTRNEKILLQMQKQDEKFEKGVRYYTLQLEPFKNYLQEIAKTEDFKRYEEIVSKVNTRLELLDLNLTASINVNHLLSRDDGLKVVHEVTSKKEAKGKPPKQPVSHIKFWKNFLVAFLGFFPLLFATILLLVTDIIPKEVYMYFSQDFLIFSVIYSVVLGMTCFAIYAIKKQKLSKKWKIVNLILFAIAFVNLFLFTIGLYIAPKTMQITNAHELDVLLHNASSSNFVLEDDIDLKDVEWEAVNFTGTIDGQNHKIENLTFKEKHSLSLFGRNSGQIANLQVVLAERTYENVSDFAAIAKVNYGSISNCAVTGALTLKSNAGSVIGGLVGNNYQNITNCNVSLTLTVELESQDITLGGLVGISTASKNQSQIDKNVVNLNLNISSTDGKKIFCGGLVGRALGGKNLSQNTSDVTIVATGVAQSVNFGGLFGEIYFASADNFSVGAIDLSELQTSGYVGGIAGQFKNSNREITILHSYSTIEISTPNNIVKGSLVGELEGRIDSCFSNQTMELFGNKATYADLVNCDKLLNAVYDRKFGFSEDIWTISQTKYPTLKIQD